MNYKPDANIGKALFWIGSKNDRLKEKKIVFYSTHILDVAEKLCSRVAIIKKGELVKVGNMQEIKGDKSLEKVFLELED